MSDAFLTIEKPREIGVQMSAGNILAAEAHERAGEAARLAGANRQTIRETVIAQGWLTGGEFDVLISPEAVCRLGTPERNWP